MQRLAIISFSLLLAACATSRLSRPELPWQQRLTNLQHAEAWQMEGRAAVAFGEQGWQASLSFRQSDSVQEVHLSGPFGIGAVVLKRSVDGVSMNGAPPSAAVLAQVQEKLGFDLPIDDLRYWLLGVPNPALPAEVTRNAEDRAQRLTQDGWVVDYDRYTPFERDLLPMRVLLSRDNVRVRVVIDRWTGF